MFDAIAIRFHHDGGDGVRLPTQGKPPEPFSWLITPAARFSTLRNYHVKISKLSIPLPPNRLNLLVVFGTIT
jgi:hypothetical protein